MKSKTKVIPAVLFLSVIIMLVSCGKQKSEWKGTIEEADGVTVVNNPKEPIYSENAVSLEEELSIGEAEGRKEYMFSQVRSIAVDDEENIYVLDRKEVHIKVFDKDGEYLRTFGKKGQGPGEFNIPSSILITPQNEIVVEDSRVLHFFTFKGEFIKSLFAAKIQFFGRTSMDSQSSIYAMTAIINMEKGTSSYELKKFDSNLNFLNTVASIPGPKAGEPFDPFIPLFYWKICENDNIIYGYQKNYEFLVFNPEGKLIKKIVKEHTPVKIKEEEKEKSPGDSLPPLKYALSGFHTAFFTFSLDEEGRIIVQTWEKTEDRERYYYDVFDPEGKYIAKVSFKFRPQIWKNHKLYTIEEDEEGFQRIKRYKITWKY
ncbi:MAG: 6-bladed beta-propeller [Candidatus Aminicenantes bacterium]|nr:6-bladed beta-propeller [Candidatus Aminicenantes bacterium]